MEYEFTEDERLDLFVACSLFPEYRRGGMDDCAINGTPPTLWELNRLAAICEWVAHHEQHVDVAAFARRGLVAVLRLQGISPEMAL